MIAALLAAVLQAAPAAAPAAVRPEVDAKLAARVLQHGPLEAPEPDPTNRFEQNAAAARLGQDLFFDVRLSIDGNRSCATCHVPARGFADGLALPEPPGASERHTLGLLNVAYQRWFFWDGRADSLWSQAFGPLDNPKELGVGAAGLARLLHADDALRAAYRAAFDAEPSIEGEAAERTAVLGAKALAAYQALLVSRDAPFDRFARAVRDGDRAAQAEYPDDALRGFVLFAGRADCRSCHAGPLFSDGEFHTIGMPPLAGGKPRDPLRRRGIELLRADRRNAAGPFSDDPEGTRAEEIAQLVNGAEQWGQVRTPSLRNAALTAPYMHQGQKATLRAVLEFYSTLEGAIPAGHHGEQVLKPLNLTVAEMDDLEAFLRSLTGQPVPGPLTAPHR